jgi:hypothetical protein
MNGVSRKKEPATDGWARCSEFSDRVRVPVNRQIRPRGHPGGLTPSGHKGLGEGGAIAAPAALLNVVRDALARG